MTIRERFDERLGDLVRFVDRSHDVLPPEVIRLTERLRDAWRETEHGGLAMPDEEGEGED